MDSLIADSKPIVITGRRAWIRNLVVALVVLVTFVALLTPLQTYFPSGTQLDDSWAVALNQALVQRLAFGERIVYSYGPYAAIYTTLYNPDGDGPMLAASFVLSLLFAGVLLLLGMPHRPYLTVTVALLLSGVCGQKDALLFAYPLLLCLLLEARFARREGPLKWANRHLSPLFLGLLFFPLGLLPLVKVSFLMPSAVSALLCALLLWRMHRWRLAFLALIVPAVSCALSWSLAQQPLRALPHYFLNGAQIVSGYTDAVSVAGPPLQIFVYLAVAAVILVGVWAAPTQPLTPRLFLSLSFALFLFMGFKAGFVRHDGPHAVAAAAVLAICALFACLAPVRARALVVTLSAAGWFYIASQNADFAVRNPFTGLRYTYASVISGYSLRSAAPGPLGASYATHRRKLAQECPLPKLDGTSDIYAARQACLFFSDNTWSPRPIFQSHFAVTPALAQLNMRHLVGPTAPDNIFFRIEPIDGRLPALEDGSSWPVLLNMYEPVRFDGEQILLRRIKTNSEIAQATELGRTQGSLGRELALSLPPVAVLATVDLRPTLLGRLVSLAFKLPEVSVHLRVAGGGLHTYRFIPSMGRTSFLLSPLVDSTRDFVLLAEGQATFLGHNRVESLRLTTSPIGTLLWSHGFPLRLSSALLRKHPSSLSVLVFDEIADAPPVGAASGEPRACTGSLDRLNGMSPVPMDVTVGTLMSVDGWMAVSVQEGILPSGVFLALRAQTGEIRYIRTRSTRRPDVRDYFGQPGLLNSGFAAYVDTSGLTGTHTLHLAHLDKGTLILCAPPRRLTIRP